MASDICFIYCSDNKYKCCTLNDPKNICRLFIRSNVLYIRWSNSKLEIISKKKNDEDCTKENWLIDRIRKELKWTKIMNRWLCNNYWKSNWKECCRQKLWRFFVKRKRFVADSGFHALQNYLINLSIVWRSIRYVLCKKRSACIRVKGKN